MSDGRPPGLSPQQQAHLLVDAFGARAEDGVFTHVRRADVARELRERINTPWLINQGSSSLCGPSALTLNVATHNPVAYVNFVIALYERGAADLRRFHVEAGTVLRAYDPTGKVAAADWIPLASIRDSENYVFGYRSADDEFAGITLPAELAAWFKKLGCRDVINDTNLIRGKGESNIREAGRLFKDDHWVCLLINSNLLLASKQNKGSLTANHWVVLTGDVVIADGTIAFEVFSWGDGHRPVPEQGLLTLGDFFEVYYGYVAAKS